MSFVDRCIRGMLPSERKLASWHSRQVLMLSSSPPYVCCSRMFQSRIYSLLTQRIPVRQIATRKKITSPLSSISLNLGMAIHASYGKRQMLMTRFPARGNLSKHRQSKMIDGCQGGHGNSPECTSLKMCRKSVCERPLFIEARGSRTDNQCSSTYQEWKKQWIQHAGKP